MITTKIRPSQSIGRKSSQDSSAGLPCLYSNNSTEIIPFKYIVGTSVDRKSGQIEVEYFDPESGEMKKGYSRGSAQLSVSQKKSAIALAWNIEYMAEKYGIEKLGFLTLTFPYHVTCMKEAQRRFNSLNSHFLNSHYYAHVAVKERHKNERIHFHLVVVLDEDIRTGFDFEALAKRDYSSANKRLKKEWALVRRVVKKYGFGRTELLPIKSTAEGISRYVGKYISKNVQCRPDRDKGTRLVNYSGDSRLANTRMTLVNQGSENWRHKCQLFAEAQSEYLNEKIDFENISEILGKRWAYKYRDSIMCLPDKDDELAMIAYNEIKEKRRKGKIKESESKKTRKKILTRLKSRCTLDVPNEYIKGTINEKGKNSTIQNKFTGESEGRIFEILREHGHDRSTRN